MVVIRMALGGSKKRPFYHIVAADSRRSRNGRHLERLGFFNPQARGAEESLRLDLERVEHWVGHGAQLSPKVVQLVKKARKQAA